MAGELGEEPDQPGCCCREADSRLGVSLLLLLLPCWYADGSKRVNGLVEAEAAGAFWLLLIVLNLHHANGDQRRVSLDWILYEEKSSCLAASRKRDGLRLLALWPRSVAVLDLHRVAGGSPSRASSTSDSSITSGSLSVGAADVQGENSAKQVLSDDTAHEYMATGSATCLHRSL